LSHLLLEATSGRLSPLANRSAGMEAGGLPDVAVFSLLDSDR